MTMKPSTLRVAALGIAFAVAAIASAQTPNPWGVRLGIVFPTGSELRDAVARNGWTLGVSYALPTKALVPNAASSAVVDYLRLGSNDNNYESFTLGYNERLAFFTPDVESGAFAGYTVGLAYNKLKATYDHGGSGGEFALSAVDSRTESKWNYFLELLAGYQINKQFSVEGFYRYTPKLEGVDLPQFGIRASYKF